ncbi:uncharacterized protein LOC127800821 isoform X3 [Diospyros lotus]|uniref:uncharacterized protein LOC127800821 isoform X3 n=1 Tax=Diospyros lotus TaxID=55363 RepID=UPI002254CA2A|nr:uncharacterized protein LOC127800821 isoform X3 [Diospyros lotus]
MAVNSCEEDAYYILVVPDEGTADPNCESQLRHAEVPNPLDCQMCLKAELNSQNCINVDRDIDVGNSLMPKTNDGDANLMTEGPLTKAFQRQISLQIGEKFMQLLMNDSSVLPKFTCKGFMKLLTTERGNTSAPLHSIQEKLLSFSLSCQLWERWC